MSRNKRKLLTADKARELGIVILPTEKAARDKVHLLFAGHQSLASEWRFRYARNVDWMLVLHDHTRDLHLLLSQHPWPALNGEPWPRPLLIVGSTEQDQYGLLLWTRYE